MNQENAAQEKFAIAGRKGAIRLRLEFEKENEEWKAIAHWGGQELGLLITKCHGKFWAHHFVPLAAGGIRQDEVFFISAMNNPNESISRAAGYCLDFAIEWASNR